MLLYRFKNHEIHIYPILVRPCAFKYADWLSKLLIRPKNAVALSSFDRQYDIDLALKDIVDEIGNILKNKGMDIHTITDRILNESYTPSPFDNIRTKPKI